MTSIKCDGKNVYQFEPIKLSCFYRGFDHKAEVMITPGYDPTTQKEIYMITLYENQPQQQLNMRTYMRMPANLQEQKDQNLRIIAQYTAENIKTMTVGELSLLKTNCNIPKKLGKYNITLLWKN